MTGETISVEGVAVQVRPFSGAKEITAPFEVVSIDGSIVVDSLDRALFLDALREVLRRFRQ